MTAHTPGPWHLIRTMAGLEVFSPDETLEVAVVPNGSRHDNANSAANAALIAAAPTLADVCRLFLAVRPGGPMVLDVAAAARVALAQVDGTEPNPEDLRNAARALHTLKG